MKQCDGSDGFATRHPATVAHTRAVTFALSLFLSLIRLLRVSYTNEQFEKKS